MAPISRESGSYPTTEKPFAAAPAADLETDIWIHDELARLAEPAIRIAAGRG